MTLGATALADKKVISTSEAASPRKRFAALDGLRGIAALIVVLFHASARYQMHLAPYAYLAVDFFFCLSGYVLAHAYSDRLKRDNAAVWFVRDRLIRLMPMISLGASLCAISYIVNGGSKTIAITGFVFSLLNIPMLSPPQTFHHYYVFPINPPQYSLFFELVINLLWVTCRRYQPLLIAVAVISSITFLILGEGGAESWNFWLGFPRAGSSFLIGVFLFGLSRKIFSKIPGRIVELVFWPLCIFAVLLLCWYRDTSHKTLVIYGWTFGVSPLLVILGAKIELPAVAEKIATIAGNLSYPLYALHLGFLLLAFALLSALQRVGLPAFDEAGMLTIMLSIAIAGSWLAYKHIDVPLRAWLSQRLHPHFPL